MVRTVRLKSGWLLTLRTEVRGGVSYEKEIIEDREVLDNGAERSIVENTRIVHDPEEQEAAEKLRDKCRAHILSPCARSESGYLCPEEKGKDLFARIDEAQQWVSEFNKEAKLNHIVVKAIPAHIMADDVYATRAVFDDIRGFLRDIDVALREKDATTVRAICDRATNVGRMLDGDAKIKNQLAITVARNAATKIVKAGKNVAGEIDRNALRVIATARTSFLDISPEVEVETPVTKSARALDLGVA